MSKRFKWTVQFEVDELWVADGFDLTDERALMMLAKDLDFACMSTELAAKVVKAPAQAEIRRVQGYTESAT